MPNVQPYYAVKCNPDKRILATLATCGANFDCASPSEIAKVLNIGVCPDRILYANPCKKESDLRFMVAHGVSRTTFDSVCELEKIARICPHVELVMRIYANDPTARCVLSNKFGAFREEWDDLLTCAFDLGLRVVGVSFHVGSGACNPEAFDDAIKQTGQLVQKARTYGYSLHLIDIGGGFSVDNIGEMAEYITDALRTTFGGRVDNGSYHFIAEPGRYFAETVATLYTKIMGVRERRGVRDYFIPDSLYGSFNCILYDHIHPLPDAVETADTYMTDDTELIPSTVFGPTCDGFDKIVDSVPLPRLQYGDWLQWKNMGAYTIAGACDFNGIRMTEPKCVYYD